MEKRQVWLIVLACWIGVMVLIGGAWAVVRFWVMDDRPSGADASASPAYSTVRAGAEATSVHATAKSVATSAAADTALAGTAALATNEAAAIEITPLAEDTAAALEPATANPEPTELASPAVGTAEPVDTPLPTDTPRPKVSAVPSQTPSAMPTDTPAPKAEVGGRATSAPKPESFKLFYQAIADGSKQVFHQSSRTDEIVPVFDPGDRRMWVHSSAWSPGGEHVLTVSEWITSKTEFGERLRIDNRDGSGGYDILLVSAYDPGGAEQARDMGSAIWSPDGQTIAMWYLDGANDGVYLINADGTGHRRMANSQPGDWPRWWSVDGDWIVVINANGGFFALDLAETKRVPWSSLQGVQLYDQVWYPWRVTSDPSCRDDDHTTPRPWWRCR